jgi:RNA polymerase primary sigma factor
VRQFKVTDRITTRNGRASILYTQDLNRRDVMTPEEELEVAKKAAEGDKEAQDKLVEGNLRFVMSVAKMYSMDPVTIEELIQVGNIGLIEASQKFDPSMGFKFISFAVWHIRKEMIMHLGAHSRMVRLPMNKGQLLTHIRNSISSLAGKLGRDPINEEILEDLKKKDLKLAKTLDLDTLSIVLDADQKHSSLDVSIGEDSGSTLLDVIWDDKDIFDTDLSSDSKAYYLNKLFSRLSERERYVVKEHYGLNQGKFSRSFLQIGDDLEISQEMTRLINSKAIKKLRLAAKSMGIDTKDIFGR